LTEIDARRRNLVAGLAAAGVAVPVLAACGGSADTTGTTDPGGSTDASGPGSGSSTAKAGGDTIPTSEIPVGGGKIFSSDKVVVTQPTAGDFKAFTAVCTHQGCILANVSDGTINCTCHFSKFSIEDGSVVNGPATKALAEKTVTVSGSSLTVG
jgi:Rieske Fe-S protein